MVSMSWTNTSSFELALAVEKKRKTASANDRIAKIANEIITINIARSPYS